jgi:formate dehydrogenase maturation protein FdhE
VTTPAGSSRVAETLEQHALRADALARESSAAREPLRFAAGLLRAQAEIAARLESASRAAPLSGRGSRDLPSILGELRGVAEFAAREGPSPLREDARARATETDDLARMRLALFWTGDRRTAEDFLSRSMLRPYVEVLRERNATPDRERAPGHCPFCGGAPVLACRRAGSESDGAQRSLVCGLCGLEWSFQRILCPSCLENEPDKLPSFTTESHPSVRVEACETCRRYVKSLDVTHEPRCVPEVDDLTSIALDLWAIEQGFTRFEPGLAGV